jgi:transposase
MQITRGMRRQSEKTARRRQRVPVDAVIAGIDLGKRESMVTFIAAEDRRRLGRLRIPTDEDGARQVCRRGTELRERHGLGPLVAAMEPTSHFWKVVGRALERERVESVFVQSFVVAKSRELDNLTRDKTDARDAALIADLAADLRFTDTRLPAGPWAELDLLAECRNARVRERSAALQEQRALLELAWPELLAACPDLAGCHLQALLRTGLVPGQVAAMPRARFRDRVRRALGPARRFSPWMAERLRQAAADVESLPETAAAAVRWRLAAERIALADRAIADLDRRLGELLDATGYGRLRGAIPGLGDVTLANLLALIGDPARFDDARCLAKLAGSNPTERSSGEREAPGPISRRGRPTLRVIVYQAAVNLVRHNADFRARFETLTHRPGRPLAKPAAYVAVGNKLLRTLWVLAVTGEPYRSEVARGEVRPQPIAA